jgi:hypothetical protein
MEDYLNQVLNDEDSGPLFEIGGAMDSQEQLHRASCHRCGNLRKNKKLCNRCPYMFCARCAEKMIDEHGAAIFDDGCPVVRCQSLKSNNRHRYNCLLV